MAVLQEALLARAPQWLNPGGRLVYSVCSLEREEGEAQAKRVSLASDPILVSELPADITPSPQGWLQTSPEMLTKAGGIDGFFIARWRA
jgi:16S rRNA (cytosine967-C5)-methyltransferase